MIGENFNIVLKELEDIRLILNQYCDYLLTNKYCDFEFDIRLKFINQLNEILISHNLNIKYINEKIINIDWVKKELSIMDNGSAFSVIENYITYNKLALIYTLSSVVERFIRLILKKIDSSANITDEFQTIRTKVFDLLGFDKSSNEWLALTALSNMRNTIHNNGIHLARNEKLKEIQIVYHDKVIWFKHENPHMNATYEMFNFILIDLIRLARQINDHPQITNIKSIEDKIEIKI